METDNIIKKLNQADEEEKKEIANELQNEAERNERLVAAIEQQQHSAQREKALRLQAFKSNLLSNKIPHIEQADEDDLSSLLDNLVDEVLKVQIVITLLREDPSFEDIANNADSIRRFLSEEIGFGEGGVLDLEEELSAGEWMEGEEE